MYLAYEINDYYYYWPSKDDCRRTLPSAFTYAYPRCRVIIDCTEIFVERPGNLTARAATYSNYKHHNTLKYLIGITPTGSVSFISKAYGGRASDKVITQRSGFLDLLEPGDVVLADRGFLIDEDITVRHCSLKIPSFTKGKAQLSQRDVETSRQLARVRIHVERAIGRIKHFKILTSCMSLSLVPHADNVLLICSAISNLHPALISSNSINRLVIHVAVRNRNDLLC
jgi:DDE superfamily endonuclease